MSKYINYSDVIKRYHLDPNEISYEYAIIIDISRHTEEVISKSKENVDHRNMYDKSEKK